MAIVESGNYFIENVKQKNIAAVVDNNIGSPLMASVHMNNIGEVVCRYTLSILLESFLTFFTQVERLAPQQRTVHHQEY